MRTDILADAANNGITAAVCIDNDWDTARTVQGIAMYAHSVAVVVYPGTLTDDQIEALSATIYGQVPFGIRTVGDVETTAIGGDGFEKEILFSYATDKTVNIASTIVADTGYDAADLEPLVVAAQADYMLGLGVGAAVRILALSVSVTAAVPGLIGYVPTLNAGSVDVEPLITEIAIIGTNTATS